MKGAKTEMDARLADLLFEWEERREQGRPATAAELCAESPELTEALAEQIRALEAFDKVAAPDHEAPAAQVPKVPSVAGFTFDRELGRGGMGVVYRAQQINPARTVAIKMILPKAGVHALARFKSEAAVLVRLKHANVVEVHKLGEHEGRPFLVMEYCAKGSLDDHLLGRPMDPRDAAQLSVALARAVQYCHDEGVVHRDLKPGNVLISADDIPAGAGDKPSAPRCPAATSLKIADFGLAKILDSDMQLTRSGTILGTVGYMAPEQASGRTKHVGPAADIWALGAILYELLSGNPPFDGAADAETLAMIVEKDPEPPPGPTELVAICLKCLRKSPSHRYASAGAMADDLEHWLNGEPVSATLEVPPPPQAATQEQPQPWWPIVVTFATLAIAIVAAWFWLH